MQVRHALSAYRPGYRPVYVQHRRAPAPDYQVHPILWVILASGLFWMVLIEAVLALFGR